MSGQTRLAVGSLDSKLRARFWAKVSVAPADACWEWLAGRDRKGYGKFAIGQKHHRAHRIAYNLFGLQIPNDLVIDHLCRNRACVNPDHLEPVTSRENAVRGAAAAAHGFHAGVCKYGHEFTPENTYATRDGGKNCRTCVLEGCKKRRAKRLEIERGSEWLEERRQVAALRSQGKCQRGHEMTLENTHIRKNGNRLCRTCLLASLKEQRKRRIERRKAAA